MAITFLTLSLKSRTRSLPPLGICWWATDRASRQAGEAGMTNRRWNDPRGMDVVEQQEASRGNPPTVIVSLSYCESKAAAVKLQRSSPDRALNGGSLSVPCLFRYRHQKHCNTKFMRNEGGMRTPPQSGLSNQVRICLQINLKMQFHHLQSMVMHCTVPASGPTQPGRRRAFTQNLASCLMATSVCDGVSRSVTFRSKCLVISLAPA